MVSALELAAGEVGLEVCAGKGTTAKEAMKTGLWHSCDPVLGTITVNIGDALQYWSDDRLKSTFHRVRIPKDNEYKVCTDCKVCQCKKCGTVSCCTAAVLYV